MNAEIGDREHRSSLFLGFAVISDALCSVIITGTRGDTKRAAVVGTGTFIDSPAVLPAAFETFWTWRGTGVRHPELDSALGVVRRDGRYLFSLFALFNAVYSAECKVHSP